MDFFFGAAGRVMTEQFGVLENAFKRVAIGLISEQCVPLRAYLAQIQSETKKCSNYAICIASESKVHQELASNIAAAFREIFGPNEHLDICILSEPQEIQLRKVCCPFFTSERFCTPDFYLSSSEGYGLEDARACYKERRLMNGHPDGYMLCEIDPPIVGQPYGLGGQDIYRIVVASRHDGYSVFAINSWPTYVHIARLARNISDDEFTLAERDIESIGWGEIYESMPLAN